MGASLRGLRGLHGGLLPAMVLAIAVSACGRSEAPSEPSLLVPGLAAAQDKLDLLRLRGAGNKPLVTLEKKAGRWRVRERGHWPADPGRISQYLFVLSQARKTEPKTANPALYARLGVEPVSTASASGSELEIAGPGIRSRLLIGNEHARFNSNYVRMDGQAQSWLTDLPVTFDPDPAAWLDHRLIDVPLARVAAVRVDDAVGSDFSLSHRDDRFRLDDAPSAAMRDSHRGDDLAGVLDQLLLEDVSAAKVDTAPTRTLQFQLVDGIRLQVECRRLEGRTWLDLAASLDPLLAERWLGQSGAGQGDIASLRAKVAAWNAAFRGRSFLVPEAVSGTLMSSHDAILAGQPAP